MRIQLQQVRRRIIVINRASHVTLMKPFLSFHSFKRLISPVSIADRTRTFSSPPRGMFWCLATIFSADGDQSELPCRGYNGGGIQGEYGQHSWTRRALWTAWSRHSLRTFNDRENIGAEARRHFYQPHACVPTIHKSGAIGLYRLDGNGKRHVVWWMSESYCRLREGFWGYWRLHR